MYLTCVRGAILASADKVSAGLVPPYREIDDVRDQVRWVVQDGVIDSVWVEVWNCAWILSHDLFWLAYPRDEP